MCIDFRMHENVSVFNCSTQCTKVMLQKHYSQKLPWDQTEKMTDGSAIQSANLLSKQKCCSSETNTDYTAPL